MKNSSIKRSAGAGVDSVLQSNHKVRGYSCGVVRHVRGAWKVLLQLSGGQPRC